MPDNILDAELLRGWPLPQPGEGGKEERGTVVVVAGAAAVAGAALLCGTAALRAGAGKLQIATGAAAAPALAVAVPEALVVALEENGDGAIAAGNAAQIVRQAESADALVIGPGLLDERETAALVEAILPEVRIPAVIDAVALAALARGCAVPEALREKLVLTPHPGEMAKLRRCSREDVESDPIGCAREIASALGAFVALKGATTYIASPDGRLYRNEAGNSGLATSGSGDVLAGLIGGLLARGAPPLHAACWGVYLHAQAGATLARRVGFGFLAHEIGAEIPPLMRALA